MTQTSPTPIPSFGGRIGQTLAESEPSFVSPPHPPAGAPNVVIVLLDDTGFAQLGCYGSDIDTTNIDALAAAGLQFTNFHVTPLCSPTRASLLTGRSQHAVGMRSVSNHRTGFPHQLGHISNHAATLAEVLNAEGYATFCAGKWHLAPTTDISAAGPFDQWPLSRGFDRFYGFLEGETDQFYPELVIDNHHVSPPAKPAGKSAAKPAGNTPAKPAGGYHLSEDLVDQLLRMINDSKGIRPDRPFFAYLPFGATHAPHQAPQRYMDKYRGRYDEGWDVVRQRWYQRQLELGIIAADTELAPRNPGVEPWDDLSENQRKLACRLQEAFAAFLDHTDDQIGRLVAGLRDMGELDNTIFLVLADNGASQEGGPTGVMHEMKHFNGIAESPDEAVKRLDDIGGPNSHTNYPWGWAQCGNSPFKWYKQNTHEGGVHVPLVMHWPSGIAGAEPAGAGSAGAGSAGAGEANQQGALRHQFINVADIAPTIYELLAITPPDVFDGKQQLPITGHSFSTLLAEPTAAATNRLQYFEMFGSRALVAELDGTWWKAVTRHNQGDSFDDDRWELYNLSADLSECNDQAEAEPERLAELIQLWWNEAERHGVLPLDDRTLELFAARLDEHSPHRPDRRYHYRPPLSPIPAQASASPGGRSWEMTARLTRAAGDQGVIWATGSANSGMSVFVQNDRLVVDYNAFGDHTVVESEVALPVGECTVQVLLRRNSRTSGTIDLVIDGQPSGGVAVEYLMRMISSLGASVGYDHGSAVSTRYDSPNEFTGKLHEVEIVLGSRPKTDGAADAEATARTEMARQ